jgi:hypothetical protein
MRNLLAQLDRLIEARRLWLVASLVVFAVHIGVVFASVVDVPLYDDWYFFVPSLYGPWGSWDWFLSFHNEHRLVVTKALFWLMQKIGHLNLATIQHFNIFFYGGLLVLLGRLCQRAAPENKTTPAFLFFLTSAICSENIAWAIQSQYHVCLILFAAALLLLERKTWGAELVASGLLVLATFTMSGGVMLALSVALFYPVFAPTLCTLGTRCLRVSLPLAAGIMMWTHNYPDVSHHPSYSWPWTIKFWGHFTGMLSWLVGSDGLTAPPTLLAFLFLVALMVFVGRSVWQREWSLPFGFVVGVLMMLATLSMGRAGQGTGQGKADRYAQLVVILLPFVVIALARLAAPRLKVWSTRLLWLACVVGFADNFNIWAAYQARARFAQSELVCLGSGSEADKNTCPGGHPLAGSVGLSFAREVGATFVEKILRP